MSCPKRDKQFLLSYFADVTHVLSTVLVSEENGGGRSVCCHALLCVASRGFSWSPLRHEDRSSDGAPFHSFRSHGESRGPEDSRGNIRSFQSFQNAAEFGGELKTEQLSSDGCASFKGTLPLFKKFIKCTEVG